MRRASTPSGLGLQARFFRGLADPSRLAILYALRSGERTVSEVATATGLSISNASRHLTCLKECGLVDARPCWRHMYYRLAEGVAELLTVNESFVTRVAARIAACSEPDMGEL